MTTADGASRQLRVEAAARVLHYPGRRVRLSPTECKLLVLLLRNPGRVVTKEEIFRDVWGYDFRGNDNVIQTYVSYLRRKLGPRQRRRLRTVRGVGYVLDIEGAPPERSLGSLS